MKCQMKLHFYWRHINPEIRMGFHPYPPQKNARKRDSSHRGPDIQNFKRLCHLVKSTWVRPRPFRYCTYLVHKSQTFVAIIQKTWEAFFKSLQVAFSSRDISCISRLTSQQPEKEVEEEHCVFDPSRDECEVSRRSVTPPGTTPSSSRSTIVASTTTSTSSTIV